MLVVDVIKKGFCSAAVIKGDSHNHTSFIAFR